MKIKNKINSIKLKITQVFIAMKNKNTPWYAKVVAFITVSYALSPIDLIPDFIPILGYLDDLIILPILIFITISLIPKLIWDQCEEEAKEIWKDGKPRKWYYSIPIIMIWIIIISFLCYILYRNVINY